MAGQLEPGVRFTVEYRCPHCQATLEDRAHLPGRWLRCPKCGRAGRSPGISEVGFVRGSAARPREDILFLDEVPDRKPLIPIRFPARARRPGSVGRVISATVLFASITFLIFALMEGNARVAMFFVGLAFVSLFPLIRFSRW